jgi:hypothetical protein
MWRSGFHERPFPPVVTKIMKKSQPHHLTRYAIYHPVYALNGEYSS